MDYLNLDEVKPQVVKSVTLFGKKHQMRIPTVGEFADDLREMKRLEEKFGKFREADSIDDEVAIEAIMEFQVNSVRRAFPTIPDEDFDQMTREQLTALRNFIQVEVDAANEAAEGDEEETTGNGEDA